MENSDQDETQPFPVNPQDETNFDISDTQPTPVPRPNSAPPEADQTMPVNVDAAPTDFQGGDATMPVEVRSQPPQVLPPGPLAPKPKKRRFPALASWSLLGLLGLLLIGLISAFGGYNAGIDQRKQAQASQEVAIADEQFQLALQDMQAGRYDLARQRFEYVIELNPGYPGVTDKLADVLLYMNATATPTVTPTPTITPTPDTRNVQELFSQAQQELANSNWSTAIDTLLSLRKADPNYQPVWVDGMLYVSFLNRGREKILNQADLEGGIYDMTVAEKFGLLDTESRGLQNWARLYITGASFWELDWAQVVYYFAQIAPALPNLRDGSGWTAAERYRLALIGYGGDLAEKAEWCDAQEQLELALSMGPDEQASRLLEDVSNVCGGGDSGGSDNSNSNDNDNSQQPAETEAPPTEEQPGEPAATEPPPDSTPAP